MVVLAVLAVAIPVLGFILDACMRGMAHGRPLRVRGRRLVPRIRHASELPDGPSPDPSHLDSPTRDALAALWLHDAQAEYASVPAFSQIAWHLAALGAPAALLARAHQSAMQEIDHAERCFALASAYAQTPLGPAPMPELASGGMTKLPRDRVKALTVIARDALVDGALLESCSAAVARVALEGVTDSAVRETLERIAADEAAHAELAWDMIAFCIDSGGQPVMRALRHAAKWVAVLPPPSPFPREHLGLLALADPSALRAHGRVLPESCISTYIERRTDTLARLDLLLARSQSTRAESIQAASP